MLIRLDGQDQNGDAYWYVTDCGTSIFLQFVVVYLHVIGTMMFVRVLLFGA